MSAATVLVLTLVLERKALVQDAADVFHHCNCAVQMLSLSRSIDLCSTGVMNYYAAYSVAKC